MVFINHTYKTTIINNHYIIFYIKLYGFCIQSLTLAELDVQENKSKGLTIIRI